MQTQSFEFGTEDGSASPVPWPSIEETSLIEIKSLGLYWQFKKYTKQDCMLCLHKVSCMISAKCPHIHRLVCLTCAHLPI